MADPTQSWRAALTDQLESVWRQVLRPQSDAPRPEGGESDSEQPGATSAQIRDEARALAPVVWLLGKVQAGKSSIVRALSGAADAEIGQGYAATTRTARIYDVPAEAPVLRFLDSRGLGEAGYDPAEDMAMAEASAHLLLVVMRAMDPQQGSVVEAVRRVRAAHPDWPVIAAQTALHEGYRAGNSHPAPDPFASQDTVALAAAGVPTDLVRALAYQRGLFADVPGRAAPIFVPLDLTLPEDGLTPPAYGLDRLLTAIEMAAPAALSVAVRALARPGLDQRAARAHPHILGYASAAAAIDLLPAAGLVGVPAVQAKMLHSLAAIYGVAWDRRTLGELAGCLGTGTLVRLMTGLGARQLAKLIPVWGQTAGAAAAAVASFSATYALGRAASFFLERRLAGKLDPEGVARAYAEGLEAALAMARERAFGRRDGGSQ